MSAVRVVSCVFLVVMAAEATTYNIMDQGAVPDEHSLSTCLQNSAVMNMTLAKLAPGDTLLVPNRTFFVMGGIVGRRIRDVTIQIDGTLSFSNDTNAWPRSGPGHKARVMECIQLSELTNVTFTSNGVGTLNGNGEPWWGLLQYLLIGENRPRSATLH